FVRDSQSLVVTAMVPPNRIDIDRTNLPEKVLAALEEAVTCHANECYVACGMMVRKTLERLCEDRNASGADLKSRIKALADTIVVPKELVEAMDELRLLGNDAAHVQARTFDEVGKEEVETSLELAKELLKAVYQYSALLAKLRAM